METFLIKALQLMLSLSILVLVHEFGHFIFARLFKVRVEKFYLFFDPWFALFRYKPKHSETEYGIGWLPLGGYCKISGMIDESMDTEAMAQPPTPSEFRSKPAGQRLLIMIGGVLFNFLLALFIYSMILFHWGDTYLPLKNMKMGMDYSETFHNIGFQDGDILLKADAVPLERFGEDCLRSVIEAKTVTVLRDGKETVIPIPEDLMQRLLRDKKGFASLRFPMIVRSLPDSTAAAARAGLQPGDSILSVNNEATPTFTDAVIAFNKLRNQEIRLGISRAGVRDTLTMQVDSLGKIGVAVVPPAEIYEMVTLKYNFFQSFPAGVEKGVNTLTARQRKFCDEYLIDCNATQAAIRAGYSPKTAKVTGAKMLTNANLKAYIDEQLERIHNEKTADAQEVLEYLTAVMRGQHTEQTLQLIGDGVQKIADIDVSAKERLKAAELIGKRYGMFKDNVGIDLEPVVIVNDLKE